MSRSKTHRPSSELMRRLQRMRTGRIDGRPGQFVICSIVIVTKSGTAAAESPFRQYRRR
jgi:hypothetical protein